MTTLLIQLAGSAVAALVAAFMAVNMGLRLLPEGRAFLASARAEGRMLADPARSSAAAVRGIVGLAVIVAVVIAVLTFFRLGALLEPAVVPYPKTIAAAAAPPGRA